MTDVQVRELVHLACTTRPNGARRWDEAGTYSQVRKLVERGLSGQEIIYRTLMHAWDAKAESPGVLAYPVPSAAAIAAEDSRLRLEDECTIHPGKRAGSCSGCAADAIGSDPERRGAPIYHESGEKLRHRPLRELFEENRTELETNPADVVRAALKEEI